MIVNYDNGEALQERDVDSRLFESREQARQAQKIILNGKDGKSIKDHVTTKQPKVETGYGMGRQEVVVS